MNTETLLTSRQCTPCRGGVPVLGAIEAEQLLQKLSGWRLQEQYLEKVYSFKNYYETMAFVNASAWVSHRQDHHPDLTVGYNQCIVRYTTHAIAGLSENDFICAAKLDALWQL